MQRFQQHGFQKWAASATSRTKGRLLVLAAALLWSTSGLFVKAPVFDAWSPETRGPLLAFWRAAFAALLLLPMVRRPRWRPQLAPMTISFAAMNVTYLTAMSLTTAANAIWLQSTAPLWVFLVGVVWIRSPIDRRDLAPLCLAVVGMGVILRFELLGEARAGVMFGLVSGALYAGVVLSLRALRGENGVWLVALNQTVAALVLLPYVIYLGVWPTPAQLAVLAPFGFFQIGLPYILFARGLRHITAQEAALIGLLEPMLAPGWAYLIKGESPAWWTFAGAGLILLGLVWRLAVRDKPPPAADE